MGSTGMCRDNAVAESYFATLKNEMHHRQYFATKARAQFVVADYIEGFYNRKRMHSTLGYRTPAQALNDYCSAAAAAGPTEQIKPRDCPESLTQPNNCTELREVLAT